jgi:tetrahydromethanopterin S-methyltransferase subunit G
MSRTNLFIKVEIEHDREEDPQRLGEEICRQIGKIYGVLSAELSSFTRSED